MKRGQQMNRVRPEKDIFPFDGCKKESRDFLGENDPGFVLRTFGNIDLDENYGSLFSRVLETAEPVKFDEE
tara:strand:- start:24352 stop:24564 length:213 start_codon:yes stop_codon:yes gene_type:complete